MSEQNEQSRPQMSSEEIKPIDRALDELRQAVNLPPHDAHRADATILLRRAGFTANQIVKLSRGKRPHPSVNRWVKTISVLLCTTPALVVL